MSEIYEVLGADSYEFCYPVRSEDFENISMTLNGTPRRDTWHSPPMRLIREGQGLVLSESDSPWYGGDALIFRKSVISKVGSFLNMYGELLPLSCPQADLVIFNVTRVLDALNVEESKVERFSTGRIMDILRHVFYPDVIRGVDVFKIPNLRVSPIYVSERFVDIMKKNKITGLDFIKVWSSG